ncbi:MAG: carboxypeptidase regulatory-like domain-containing protein, partial [Acidobacteriaceae bacterium]|nr:carboxypeptidase regulatory-like domain-containing protein [Acidobacteriaceae bacterium]
MRRALSLLAFAAVIALCAQRGARETVRVDSHDIGGVVTSAKGPEAGVWVIAETRDLPTKFVKIVVTDERGGYLVPDLPNATYNVWVRGYGLIDSPKLEAKPGARLNLTATIAPNPHAAAEYYPASYWYSLLRIPDKSDFPGTGPEGNGIATGIKSQAQWLERVKTDSCWSCHQLGNKATREIPKALGNFDSPVKAWERRIQSGQAGGNMVSGIGQLGSERALAMFADWTSRIAAGELP